MMKRAVTAVVVLAFAGAGSALAQEAGLAPPASQPSSAPAPAPAPKPPPRSLDDLLKIGGEKPATGEAAPSQAPKPGEESAAAQDARRELEKQLTEAEVANSFVQAIEKMGLAADMLDVRFDPGLDTQRVQEDIIAKLAQLLDQAKKNRSQSKSSSSSSSSSQQRQNQPQDPGQRQQPQNQNAPGERNPNPADNRHEIDPPAEQQANPNSQLNETRSEWGNLPQRLRDQLIQGRKDHFSTLYERLTQEYYKRLAEEGSP